METGYEIRPHRKKKPFKVLLILFVIFFLIRKAPLVNFLQRGMESVVRLTDSFAQQEIPEADTFLPWNLLLVNSSYRVPDGYTCDRVTLSNGCQIDARIYPSLQQMFDDARTEGLALYVREGYRTREQQQDIWESRYRDYLLKGYSKREAKKLTEDYVAIPGCSEHQLGLAVDINAESGDDSDSVYTWLLGNAYRYGFIKRYPADKTEITGIDNEPWHYRYVGQEAAKEITERGLCLEEYIAEKYKGNF